MNRNQRRVMIFAAVALAIGAGIITMQRHTTANNSAPTRAQSIQGGQAVDDRDPEIAVVRAIQETKVRIADLSVRHVGGDRGSARRSRLTSGRSRGRSGQATRLQARGESHPPGHLRRRRHPPRGRAPASHVRALDGCMLKVSCERGVLSVSGTVQSELQADAARSVLKTVSGAHEVHVDLKPTASSALAAGSSPPGCRRRSSARPRSRSGRGGQAFASIEIAEGDQGVDEIRIDGQRPLKLSAASRRHSGCAPGRRRGGTRPGRGRGRTPPPV